MQKLALVSLVLLGCSGAQKAGLAQARADLVVATYNVNFGLAGDRATLQAIRDTRADVVLLQETTPAWERALRAALSRRYPYMVFRHSAKWPAGGLGFLSRFPLHELQGSASAVGFFPAWRAVVHTPAGPVQLVNLHLKPPVSSSGSYVSGYFSTPPQRAREMERHLALVRQGLPTILLGDFNESSGGGLARLEHRELRDAANGSVPTWRWKVGPFVLRKQLDHIVYDPGRLECLEARVLQRGRSDHLPVVARFRLRRGSG